MVIGLNSLNLRLEGGISLLQVTLALGATKVKAPSANAILANAAATVREVLNLVFIRI